MGLPCSVHNLLCGVRLKFSGGKGDDKFKTPLPPPPPPPYEQHLPLPTSCLKMFLERSLNDLHPHHPTSSIFHFSGAQLNNVWVLKLL